MMRGCSAKLGVVGWFVDGQKGEHKQGWGSDVAYRLALIVLLLIGLDRQLLESALTGCLTEP
jgi:hypothetical protein